MNKKELFIKLYQTHLDFEKKLDILEEQGLELSSSFLSIKFYDVFEIAVDCLLTPEGSTILFEDILWVEGIPLEEVMKMLDPYFI